MRILVFHDVAEKIGGAETYVSALVSSLSDAGHGVVFASVSHAPGDFAGQGRVVFFEPKAGVWRFLMKVFFNPFLFARLFALIRSFRPGVVHLNHNNKYFLAVLLAARLNGVPVVQTVHDFGFLCPTVWHTLPSGRQCRQCFGVNCVSNGCITPVRFIIEALYRPWKVFCDKLLVSSFIAPSKGLKEELSKNGFNSVHVPYLVSLPKKVCPYNAKSKNVLFVGALTAQKGVWVLLKAFAFVLKKQPRAVLEVVGAGPLRAGLEKQCKDLGLSKKVLFKGVVANEFLDDFYCRANVVVVSSVWREQFGLVGVEALARGRPVVASRVGGIPEWLSDGESGFLCSPGDDLELSEKILKLLGNPKKARRFGLRGREIVLDKFCSRERHLNAVFKVYRDAGA